MNIENYATLNQSVAHESTSAKYAFVPTSAMIDVLADHGWNVAKVQEVNARANPGFQKHIVRLRHADYSPTVVGEYIPEIVLRNSHNGSSSFELLAGVYRLVCSNGAVVGESFQSEKIRHSGFATHKAERAVKLVADSMPRVIESVESMRRLKLADNQREAFASAAIELMKDDGDTWSMRPSELLRTRRYADRADSSLWGTFNVVQENILRGGVYAQNERGQYRRTRAVKNIDRDVKLNRALWTLAEELQKAV